MIEQTVYYLWSSHAMHEYLLCNRFVFRLSLMSSCFEYMYPCLGRCPEIGTLYDCRTERFIPEVTLWNPEAISRMNRTEATSKTLVSVEDSLQSKFKSLEMDDNTSLSFLAGMIPVKGGAEYLRSEKALSNEIQVVLEYHCTQSIAELPKDQLKTEKRNELDKCILATHVVTGVEYGIDAFFVFRRKLGSNEICGDAERAALIEVINKSVFENAELLEAEKQQVNELKCTYYGDICLPQLPTSFQEAIDVFKTYFMCNQEPTSSTIAVPKKVSLLPLSLLYSQAPGTYFSISNRIIEMSIKMFEQSRSIRSVAKSLQESCIYEYLLGINAQLETFCATLSKFQSNFQKTLQQLLPKIRGGELGEQELLGQIAGWKESPFDESRLQSWIAAKKKEKCILEPLFKQLEDNIPNVRIVNRNADLISASAGKKILYYSFGEELAKEDHIFLHEIESYSTGNGTNSIESWDEDQEWYNNDNTVRCANNQLESFVGFARINMRPELDFAVITCIDTQCKRVAKDFGSIALFSNSKWRSFQPPSPPLNIQVEKAESESLQISWKPPIIGANHVTGYSVIYHQKEWKEEVKSLQTEGNSFALVYYMLLIVIVSYTSYI